MRRPRAPNSPLNAQRYRSWTDRFGSYRSPVTRPSIEEWLNQFRQGADRDTAARVLDAIMYFNQADISSNFRSMLQSLEGWHIHKTKRQGRWFFVPLARSAGESGDTMLHQFRIANGLATRQHDELFIFPTELVRKKLTNEDTVVLVDDFSGSGTQVCKLWNDKDTSFSELTAGAGRVFLILLAATSSARNRIKNETAILLNAAHTFNEKDNLFSDSCAHFSATEKSRILAYNRTADNQNPKGFADCGLLVVFYHRCPNNSIPVLHMFHNRWDGLFPRHD